MKVHDAYYGPAQDFRCEDLRDMSGFILIFDISSKDFLYHTRPRLDRIRRATESEPPIVFIRNKSDKQDAISYSAIRTTLESDYFAGISKNISRRRCSFRSSFPYGFGNNTY